MSSLEERIAVVVFDIESVTFMLEIFIGIADVGVLVRVHVVPVQYGI